MRMQPDIDSSSSTIEVTLSQLRRYFLVLRGIAYLGRNIYQEVAESPVGRRSQVEAAS